MLKETKNPYSIFRITRTAEIRKIGFRDPVTEPWYMETKIWRNHLDKLGLHAALIDKGTMHATEFRAPNKGYPKDFNKYYSINEKEDKRLYGADRHSYRYVSEIDLSKRGSR